jgi:hypothetical protein
MNWAAIPQEVAVDGTLGVAGEFAQRALSRFTRISVLRVLVLERAALRLPPPSAADSWRHAVLTDDALEQYAQDAVNDLPPAFIAAARAKGDRCFGVFDGDVLASYIWCSVRATEIQPGLVTSFDPQWTYTYKAFTVPAYRGRRLHAHVKAVALSDPLYRYSRGALSCVEMTNVASMRSLARMGAVCEGTVLAAYALGRYWTRRSERCRHYNVRLSGTAA